MSSFRTRDHCGPTKARKSPITLDIEAVHAVATTLLSRWRISQATTKDLCEAHIMQPALNDAICMARITSVLPNVTPAVGREAHYRCPFSVLHSALTIDVPRLPLFAIPRALFEDREAGKSASHKPRSSTYRRGTSERGNGCSRLEQAVQCCTKYFDNAFKSE